MRAGKSRSSEAIYTGGVQYLMLNGQWQRSPMSHQALVEVTQENLKTHPDTCTLVGDQTVGGQAMTAFKVHNRNLV